MAATAAASGAAPSARGHLLRGPQIPDHLAVRGPARQHRLGAAQAGVRLAVAARLALARLVAERLDHRGPRRRILAGEPGELGARPVQPGDALRAERARPRRTLLGRLLGPCHERLRRGSSSRSRAAGSFVAISACAATPSAASMMPPSWWGNSSSSRAKASSTRCAAVAAVAAPQRRFGARLPEQHDDLLIGRVRIAQLGGAPARELQLAPADRGEQPGRGEPAGDRGRHRLARDLRGRLGGIPVAPHELGDDVRDPQIEPVPAPRDAGLVRPPLARGERLAGLGEPALVEQRHADAVLDAQLDPQVGGPPGERLRLGPPLPRAPGDRPPARRTSPG